MKTYCLLAWFINKNVACRANTLFISSIAISLINFEVLNNAYKWNVVIK